MPYNPNSSYPRHTTYTPPIYGREYARAHNEPRWGDRPGGGIAVPPADVAHALAAASRQPDMSAARAGLEAAGRQGMLTMALDTANRRGQQLREIKLGRAAWNRAEHGDDPNEMAPQGPREIDLRTPEGKAEARKLFPSDTGGRAHSAPVNDRLGPIEQREQTTSLMNRAVSKVLSGKSGGPMKVPWRFGSTRRK